MTIHLPRHRWVWNRLGLAPTADRREIRKAYAARLKAIDTDADPGAFIALREAWEAAQLLAAEAARAQAYAPDPAEGAADPAPLPADPGPIEAAAAADPVPEVVVTELPPSPSDSLLSTLPPEVIVRPAPEAPRAAEPAAADYPEAALFARIEALLAGEARADEAETLRAATEALLAHPSLDRIRVAALVEDWLAGVIEDFHPRSDPVLEAAGAHYRWAARQDDWKAPYFVGWAARRLKDLAFERRLVAERPRFGEVLALLRSDVVPPPAEQARRLAPDVRDFADYARLHHPSSVEACSRIMLDWWNAYFEGQPAWQREWDNLRRAGRGRSGIWTVEPAPRLWPSGRLWIGLLIAPYLFAWTLLKRGYAPALRFAGFAWLTAMVAYFLAWTPPPEETGPPPRPPIVVATASYASALDDLEPLLDAALASEGSYFGLAIRNKPLFDRLLARWEQARAANEDKQVFATAIRLMIERAFDDGIAAGDAALQRDYWRFHADRLKWLRDGPGGAAACAARMQGRHAPLRLPPELERRRRALVERAIFGTPPAARGAGAGEGRHALTGQDCGERIAVIEAALALPPAEREAALRAFSEEL